MGNANPKAAAAAAESEATAVERARAALERDGSVKLSAVGSKTSRAAIVSELVRQGFEVTKVAVRKPLSLQLSAALADGAFIPLKSVAQHVSGSSAAEAKQAALGLVANGVAKLVLRGVQEVLVPATTAVLSPDELARFGELAKTVAKLAKSKTGASLLCADLDEAIARVLPARGDRRVTQHLVSPEKRSANDQRRVLFERLLAVVDTTRDAMTGLSFVPAIVAQLRAELSPEVAGAVLVDAASDGLLELRPEGGINRLSEAELAVCPPGPQGTRLSWARRTEVVAQ